MSTILRRSWLVNECGEIAKDIPLNTPLIPVLSEMSSTYGTVVGQSVTDSANNLIKAANGYAGAYPYILDHITQSSYKIFATKSVEFAYQNNEARDISFTFSSNFYRGYLNAGKYRFKATFQQGSSYTNYNILVCEDIYVKDMSNNWILVARTPYSLTSNTTVNTTVDFTYNGKFKGIRMYHMNPNNVTSTNYNRIYLYNVNLLKLA